MSRGSTVISFRQPDAIDDPLIEVAREGARRMLAQVLIVNRRGMFARRIAHPERHLKQFTDSCRPSPMPATVGFISATGSSAR